MSSDSQDSLGQSTGRRGQMRNTIAEGKGNINTTTLAEQEPLISQGGIKRDGITRINMTAYAVGHVYNDF
jgi:hypothetical protein